MAYKLLMDRLPKDLVGVVTQFFMPNKIEMEMEMNEVIAELKAMRRHFKKNEDFFRGDTYIFGLKFPQGYKSIYPGGFYKFIGLPRYQAIRYWEDIKNNTYEDKYVPPKTAEELGFNF